jgi:hypothetical protein
MKVTDVGAAYDAQFERVEMSDKLRAAAQAAYKAMIAAELSDGSKREWEAAVDGLKAALAEPAIKESLTVAEQEPMHPEIKKMYEDYFDKCYRESSAQQRPWVGLTDEEINLIYDRPHIYFTQYAKDIEAKLREKNDL